MFKPVLTITLFCLAAVPFAAQAAEDINATIDGVFGDHVLYEEAFVAIQTAVVEYEAEAVAEWIAYPIGVTVDGQAFSIEGPAEFVERYDTVITEEVREAVANQRYDDLFVNAEGVMFGNGQMWISGVCGDDACTEFAVRIVAIQSTTAD